MLTHGSLFDGFGGLRRGLEDAGFITKWARDVIYGQDIETDDPADFERVDLISGGPSCQRGSRAAAWHKQRDYKTGWPGMLRFIEALRPPWVLLENVRGFQRQMVDWTADLHKLGYGCAGQLVNSRHWVPQERTRAFIVGRMGAEGLELWHYLYTDGERVEGAHLQKCEGERFYGNCPDCMRGGIFARVSARRIALMGAGNAVTQPVAEWIGRRIVEASKL